MNVLGLDLGTGWLKLAILDKTGNPGVLTDEWGDSSIRCVLFIELDRILVGTVADNAGFQDPGRCIRGWKRFAGTDTVLAVGPDGKEYRARDCARILIAHAKDTFQKKTGELLDGIAIGIPANYTQRQRCETKEAAEAVGLEVLVLSHEPTAAALGNGVHKRGDGIYGVADLGDGTYDVSVIRVSGNNLETMATGGVPKLGGYDFSMRLQDLALDQFAAEHGFRPDPAQYPLVYQDLFHRVEQAKHTLTRLASATIVVGCNGLLANVTVTREQFRTLCADLIEGATACTAQVLDDCGVRPQQIRELLAVGGGSMMPIFAEALEQRIGVKPTSHCEAIYAAALGCATAARLAVEQRGQSATVGGTRLPPISLYTREITSHDLGVGVLTEDSTQRVLAVLLPRNSPIPCDRTRTFRLAEPGQTDARIELMQGREGMLREACAILGYLDLVGLPPVFDAPHVIEVRLRVDANGILWAQAFDPLCGKRVELSVDYRNTATAASPDNVARSVAI